MKFYIFAVGNESLGFMQALIQGGVPLLLLFACFVLGYVIKNLSTRIEDGLERERSLEVQYRDEIKSQLQEQIKSAAALTEALTKHTLSMDRVETLLKECQDLNTRVSAKLDSAGA